MFCVIYMIGLSSKSLALVRNAFGADCELTAFDSPEAGVARAQAIPPEAVVVNFPLPLKDGRTAVTAIRENASAPDVRIIALTSWNYRRTREAAMAMGCDAFLSEDVELNQLRNVCQDLLIRPPVAAAGTVRP